MADVIRFPKRRFVNFYPEPVVCDNCGEETKCRVYDESSEIVCGVCGAAIFEFETIEPEIMFTPE